MMEIDGNYLEGGGQILRTSVALSCLTGKPVHIFNIRAGRPTPGLKTQHLAAISAVAELCDAKLEGNEIGSEEISFYPGEINKEKLTINISTAGSVGLVLQAIFPACVNLIKPLKIEIIGGGTFGKWAPSVVYLQKVFLPTLEKFGFRAEVKIIKHGFYPRGGAKVVAEIFPSKLKGHFIKEGVDNIKGISIVSEKLRNAKVAERQVEGAKKVLENLNLPMDIKTEYVNSTSVGTGIELWTDKTILGAGTLGEIGKKAEKVGNECAEMLVREINSGATVDKHLADQLIPFMGLAEGNSGCKVSELTNHTKTNIWVTEKFLDRKFEVKLVSGLYEVCV